MPRSPKKNKPARWAYLDELDGRPIDDAPIRGKSRKLMHWEIFLYVAAGILWVSALYALLANKVGATGFFLLGGAALFLRSFLYEFRRRRRCKNSLLGTVDGFTRRRHFRKNTRYPIVCFEVDGVVYQAHSVKPAHPSTKGNEEWIRYNPANPEESFVVSDSKLKTALLMAALTSILGVIFLILEAS